MRIGLQLYSLKDYLNKSNFKPVLEKVRSMGYTGLEAVERDLDPDTVHTFCGKKASEVRSVLAEVGLQIISSHVGFDDLHANFDGISRYHEAVGCDTFVIAGIPGQYFQQRSTVRKTVDDLRTAAEKAERRGFHFAFHNCPFNFIDPAGYDLFAEMVGEELALQPDSGNANMVGVDPVAYFGKMKNRFVSLHIKDSKKPAAEDIPLDGGKPGEEGKQNIWKRFSALSVPVGKGAVDIRSFIRLGAERQVEWLIIEEEIAPDPVGAVHNAYRYLEAMLAKLPGEIRGKA